MKLEQIISSRNYNMWPSWDLVYEWENIISERLGLSFHYEKKVMNNRYLKRIPFLLQLFQTALPAFRFDMTPNLHSQVNNRTNIIPCIVDFYLKEKQLKNFYNCYKKNKVVLVSNREVYDYLKSINCPLNIQHLALSISDIYRIDSTTRFEKKYDLVMMGRQNPILKKFVDEYAAKHRDFKYVYRIQNDGVFNYYTSDGDCLGDINTRDKYIKLMQSARVGLYSTPGIDGGEVKTNGFSQVTPRFLELIACGCHVLARYKNNSDTQYYELEKFSPILSTYDEFEDAMDKRLRTEVSMKDYSDYLSKHYTSVRCQELNNLIMDL